MPYTPKLDPELVQFLYLAGFPRSWIARLFGVSGVSVWKHTRGLPRPSKRTQP